MATHGNRFIRLRLFFDYPPPAVVGCRMCWLLVDLNACRVVADLESLIRDKFEFSRGSILSLFVEDCYLPHTESVQVVRDNDGVRVKVECLSQVNGLGSCSDTTENYRKRRRDSEAELGEELLPVKCKKKKKKKTKRSEKSTAETESLVSPVDKEKSPNKKHMKKKKKTEKETVTNGHTAPKPTAVINESHKSTKKVPVSPVRKPNGPLSGSSSSCKEKNKPEKDSSSLASSKAASNPKPTPKNAKPPSSSSSSETDDSSEEDNAVKVPPKPRVLSPTTTRSKCPVQSTNCAQKPSATMVEAPCDGGLEPHNQDDEEEDDDIQLVIKRPQPSPLSTAGRGRGYGRARGQHWAGVSSGDRSRAEGNEAIRGSEFKEPSTLTDSLTNVSVVLQNGAESVPKDYSSMPLLAAPPQLGQKIAFKLLELTESYTPEISEYKEGKIVNFDPITKQIELELLNPSQGPVEPGKFDLVYQNPDGSERVEYAVPRGSWVTERWESLLEPRLVI